MQKISIVIPTRNEQDNIKMLLLSLLFLQEKGYDYEAVVVDDSEDATPVVAKGLGARVITGQRKGLGQAIIDGIKESKGEIVLVMDADLSHAPKYIPDMIDPILYKGYDMTIGSRYVKGGKVEGWGLKRKLISGIASAIAYPVTWLEDNTSGFFAIRKSLVNIKRLRADSWKIMLEVLIRSNPIAVKEVPITFVDRTMGKSKFTLKEVRRYLIHLARLFVYKYQAVLKFGMIGASGSGIHFLLLYLLTSVYNVWYILSAIVSIVVASTWNYALNHRLTFTDRHISNHIIGWTKYQLMSVITDMMYLGLLAFFVEIAGMWYLAGAFVAVILIFPVKFLVASGMIWSKKINVNDADYDWNAFYKGSPIQKWWKRSIAETVWEWLPNNSSLLDIGCGSSPIIAKYENATGIDLNRDKINFMQGKYPNLYFSDKYLETIENKFDYILCIEVLEHQQYPDAMLTNISRLLKDGGLVVIATPDYSKWWWNIAERFTPYKEEHTSKWTRETLEFACEIHGLEPVKYKYVAGCDLIEMFKKVA